MVPVILSGGSGSRMWPLSRKDFPKQFLSLVSEYTLLQDTVLRLPNGANESPIFICSEDHRFIVKDQLADIACEPRSVLLEPMGRNTAPAVALAALELESMGLGEELMLVLPADHVIRDKDRFHHALEQASKAASEGQLVLFGIEPTGPETGYGYVKAGEASCHSSFTVDSFVEKPNVQVAMQYLKSGDYYWNSGMFLFKASVVLHELKTHSPEVIDYCRTAINSKYKDLDFYRIDDTVFSRCPDISIDYAVMEKTQDAVIVPLGAGWNDVGSWSALWEERDDIRDDAGNVYQGDVIGEHNQDCLVKSNHRLVNVNGLKDTIVIETKDAVMVSHKDYVQDVKHVVEKLKSNARNEGSHHTKSYRPWGFNDSIDNGNRYKVVKLTINPGDSLSLHRHYHRAEHWIVVKGSAVVTVDSNSFVITENQSTYIPPATYHRLTNNGQIPLELIEIQTGSYLGDNDIERVEDLYGRSTTEKHDAGLMQPMQFLHSVK
ncbi:mannose-1-phosphate guanylyltransferase/mannose-6-phosphate isomerase [Vibrio sp. 404]|uniref:mannose-1-phosphate guanylyltransferase n=1 Tax=Vibrio marinisediminis TaxID=2758441 RepID=A0A7W2IVT7_9VIBR|nr:mannose-1-phosphate guanylyltransferase/mannose-6-phosphate isomerase [Vibrio marinisediminis]MBA5764362.1 mannose-1-phosphate guanylyltransferase/mannose-6-phosphate isomerase [Vibrio marinisediminis]